MCRCLIINDELWIRVNGELNGQNVNKNLANHFPNMQILDQQQQLLNKLVFFFYFFVSLWHLLYWLVGWLVGVGL